MLEQPQQEGIYLQVVRERHHHVRSPKEINPELILVPVGYVVNVDQKILIDIALQNQRSAGSVSVMVIFSKICRSNVRNWRKQHDFHSLTDRHNDDESEVNNDYTYNEELFFSFCF